ncbi:MAG: helix-turn-helix transcriptional regulator [Aureispira sp.]
MPANRNALLRYKTIDNCLQNRFRKWTLDDLVDACSDALYEYEGIDKGVSKRTVQGDIQTMRSDKLGYNAPIIVVDKRYYTYEDKEYSITNSPLTEQDLGKLSEAVAVMKQFQGFSHFEELNSMVQKLEDQIYAQKTQTKPVIDFEKNENLKGLNFLDELYQAIIRQQSLNITYQSFKARSAQVLVFYPYLLKEFRNRWFVFGKRKGIEGITSLALDRMHEVTLSTQPYQSDPSFDPTTYFKNIIGVSINPNTAIETVRLLLNHRHAPYAETKPLHPSQKIISRDYQGVVIELQVQLNFELEKLILGFGEGIQVLQPERLKRNIKNRLQASVELYQQEFSEKGLRSMRQRLEYKGHATFYRLYSHRSIHQFQKQHHRKFIHKKQADIPNLVSTYPNSGRFLFQYNFMRLLKYSYPKALLVDSYYYIKTPHFKEDWQQIQALPVERTAQNAPEWTTKQLEKVLQQTFSVYISLQDGFNDKIKVELLSGSHQQLLNQSKRDLIGSSSYPYTLDLDKGSAILVRDLLLRRMTTLKPGTNIEFLQLRFSEASLPEGWKWKQVLDVHDGKNFDKI